MKGLILTITLLFVSLQSYALEVESNRLNDIITKDIVEKTSFFGLASYYNAVNYFVLDGEYLNRIDEETQIQLSNEQYLIVTGRFNVLIVKAENLSFKISSSGIEIKNPELLDNFGSQINAYTKPELKSVNPVFDTIRYNHLWSPLAWLAKVVESSLDFIHKNIVTNWGWVIIVFGVLLKILLLPASIMTTKFQRKVSQVKTELEPILKEIKSKYDGEEAHNKIISAHKKLGVSPFYTLKPMLGSFIQIPVLIAVFNALGEMPQLIGQPFLWIDNLAYPDSIAQLGFNLPMFGHSISLLPFIMTVVTVFSTIIFSNKFASDRELKSQKAKLYLMALAFFILFYPFPAAMVLYWALANILQTIQQQIVKI